MLALDCCRRSGILQRAVLSIRVAFLLYGVHGIFLQAIPTILRHGVKQA